MSLSTHPDHQNRAVGAPQRASRGRTRTGALALLLAVAMAASACGSDASADEASSAELALLQTELELQQAANEELQLQVELAAAENTDDGDGDGSEGGGAEEEEPAPTTTAPPTTAPPTTAPPTTAPPTTTTAPPPEPQFRTTVVIDKIRVIRDCDGIEGDGDFRMNAGATVSGGDVSETYDYPNTWHTLGDGDEVSLSAQSTIEIISDTPATVELDFGSIERDQDIFGSTWDDDRMIGNDASDSVSHRDVVSSTTGDLRTGSGNCQATLFYRIDVEEVV